MAMASNALAQLHRLEGQLDAGRSALPRTRALSRRLGDREMEGIVLLNLAMVAIGRSARLARRRPAAPGSRDSRRDGVAPGAAERLRGRGRSRRLAWRLGTRRAPLWDAERHMQETGIAGTRRTKRFFRRGLRGRVPRWATSDSKPPKPPALGAVRLRSATAVAAIGSHWLNAAATFAQSTIRGSACSASDVSEPRPDRTRTRPSEPVRRVSACTKVAFRHPLVASKPTTSCLPISAWSTRPALDRQIGRAVIIEDSVLGSLQSNTRTRTVISQPPSVAHASIAIQSTCSRYWSADGAHAFSGSQARCRQFCCVHDQRTSIRPAMNGSGPQPATQCGRQAQRKST